MRHVTILALLAACNRPAPPPLDPDLPDTDVADTDAPDTDAAHTDTDVADTDTDVADTDTDTDVADTDTDVADTDTDVADTDAADPDTDLPDTGDTGSPPAAARVPGCAPAWVEPAVDLADCVARTEHAPVGYGATSAQTEWFDAAGRLYSRYWLEFAYYIPIDETWTFDPVTGDVATYIHDQDGGAYVEEWAYTWTYDAAGLPTHLLEEEIVGWGRVFETDWVQGLCGVDVEVTTAIPAATRTYEHFLDGRRVHVDLGSDGVVDQIHDDYVDPVTGALLVQELDTALAAPGAEYVYTYVYDPATGLLAEKTGATPDYDYLWVWTRDADGRVLVLDFESVKKKGGKITTWTETTTWTCPP